MFTFIGIILILMGIGSIVLKFNVRKTDFVASKNGNYKGTYYEEGNVVVPKSPKWMLRLTSLKTCISLIVVGFLLIFIAIANPIDRNSYGYRQVVENPITGETWTQFDQGWYWKGLFSKSTTYSNVITIVYATKENEPEEEVSYLGPPVEIRFSDAAKAQAEATVKWRLPSTNDKMLLVHQDNRNGQHLAETILEPYTSECLGFAAQLIESETHYSGGKSKMAEDFQSQLEDGQYIIVTKTEYQIDSTSNTRRRITDTDIRRDENDVPIRKKSNIKQYDITIVAATIKSVDYDSIIDNKLRAKIEASTRESISKQLAITAEQEAITAKRQGEKLIAETEAREQSAKREAVIRAEKEAEVAAENYKRDVKVAASTLALKKAEAEGDRLKVQAGLSPLEQANISKETAIGVAKALAGPNGITFPRIVVSGSDGKNGGGDGALQTLQLKMLNDLANDMAKVK